MDFKKINEIHTPENWVSDALNCTEKETKRCFRPRIASIITACAVMVVISISAVAALPGIYEWLSAQFGQGVSVTELSGYEITDDGFFVKDGGASIIDQGALTALDTKSVKGQVSYGKTVYDYSFDYALHGDKIHVLNNSENVIKVTSFDSELAIVWLDMGNLWNSYYVNLITGETESVADIDGYESAKDLLKLAIDVKASQNQKYLLYRSNRDTLNKEGSKGEWYVQNVKTKSETKLKRAPEYLSVDEIDFIDGSRIVIAYDENSNPLIYDCDKNEYTDLGQMPGSDFGTTLIYSTEYTDGSYIFKDLLVDKTYSIKEENKDNAVIVTREFISLLSPEGNANVYLIDDDKHIEFDCEALADLSGLSDVKVIDERTYVFVSYDKAYIVEL